jgi:hypothetical protein
MARLEVRKSIRTDRKTNTIVNLATSNLVAFSYSCAVENANCIVTLIRVCGVLIMRRNRVLRYLVGRVRAQVDGMESRFDVTQLPGHQVISSAGISQRILGFW